MKKNLILILFILLSFKVLCQKPPAKFGKIDKSYLEMKVYEKDTSASAVILCDFGRLDSRNFSFTRLLRIKILKKEGYNWANMLFNTRNKTDVKGLTYNLENGEIKSEKLKNQSIYREHITENYFNIRVSMPNVKVGSVIDIQFTHPGLPMEWRFQERIPVVWSELRLEPTTYVDYKKHFFGFEPITNVADFQWISKDVPAFKEEPYISNVENYITKFEFEISEISFPGFYKALTTSWTAICDLLLEHEKFGTAISKSFYLNPIAKEIEEKDLTEHEKLKAAYYAIKKIKWNKKNRLFTSSPSLSYVYKNELGNSADINLALLQLLRKLNFEAKPVVLSTRDNGFLSPFIPSLNKLNHVIVHTYIDNNPILIDATEDYMPYDLLPAKCINLQGRVFTADRSAWIDLTPTKKDKQLVYYDLTLDDNLTLSGKKNGVYYDYAAWKFRKNYHSFNSKEEFFNDYINNKSGLKILESTIDNIDTLELAIKEQLTIEITDNVTQIGNELYFYPSLYEQIKQNPFNLDERKYPVDFIYQKEKNIIANIAIPEGYEIIKIPESAILSLPNNAAMVLYQIKVLNNVINLNLKFSINKTIFSPDEYPAIKELYNQIINKESEPVVIRKKDEQTN